MFVLVVFFQFWIPLTCFCVRFCSACQDLDHVQNNVARISQLTEGAFSFFVEHLDLDSNSFAVPVFVAKKGFLMYAHSLLSCLGAILVLVLFLALFCWLFFVFVSKCVALGNVGCGGVLDLQKFHTPCTAF